MLGNFAALKQFANLKSKLYTIDNLAFRFHYRFTFLILLTSTVLVTSRQYIGEHIRCIHEGDLPTHVVETFCFFTTTFTVIRDYNATILNTHFIHPGVGPVTDEDPVQHHAYYQWVPFVLFIQAFMFYLPHMVWRSWEGGKIKALVEGLHMVEISKYNHKVEELKVGGARVMSISEVDGRVTQLKLAVEKHLDAHRFWAFWMILCEVFNLLNIIFQIYLTDRFLQGQFLDLGSDVVHDNALGQTTTLDIVFPKMTKCHFHKFGASGSVQQYDILCVMALNVINEKIYVFLWFWYWIVLGVSVLPLIWRFIAVICHSRSLHFNGLVFSFACPGRLNVSDMSKTIKKLAFGEWLFLYYLAKNVHSSMFRQLLAQLAKDYEGAGDESDTASFVADEVDDFEGNGIPPTVGQPIVSNF